MSEAPPESPVVEARGLTIRAGDRTLLDGASFTVARGEVVLLVGPSGSGKTVLLQAIGGLIGPRTAPFSLSGALAVLGEDRLGRAAEARAETGIVFQDYALFEGLTVRANVAFALDHRAGPVAPSEADAIVTRLCDEFGLPADARVDRLSGGQRQRAAIARTLAFAPRLLVYDEPTSGLDPASRDRVAGVIRRANDEHDATTIVVTHDVEGLLGIADRVVVLDPATHRIEEVDKPAAAARLAALEAPAPRRVEPPALASRVRAGAIRLLETSANAVEALGTAVVHLVPRWRSARWGGRFFGAYLRLVGGPSALLYFFLAGAVMGCVFTYFTFHFLPYRRFTESLLLDDMVGGLGFGLHRILVPLLTTILLAARAGTAVAADVGGRSLGRQLLAMRSLGAEPSRYLLTGILWAFLLSAPVIAILAFIGARAASAVVFAAMAPDVSLHFWAETFMRLVDAPGAWFPAGSGWVAGKYLLSAFGIGAIAWYRGARPKGSPEEVAQAITSTVIGTTALVLLVHASFALVEFR